MRWLSGIPGGRGQEDSAPSDHAVIVDFCYGAGNLDALFELERKLERAISREHAGEYDGNEVAVDGSSGTLYMYGPDADRLFKVVRPILDGCAFMKGAVVHLRYGPPDKGADEKEIRLDKPGK
jgi:hypothetical protein